MTRVLTRANPEISSRKKQIHHPLYRLHLIPSTFTALGFSIADINAIAPKTIDSDIANTTTDTDHTYSGKPGH